MLDRAQVVIEFDEPEACGCQSWDDFDPDEIKTVHHPACKFFDPDEFRDGEEP